MHKFIKFTKKQTDHNDLYKVEDNHPLRNDKPHFIFSVENPAYPKEHDMSHQDTLNELRTKGFKVHELKSKFNNSSGNSIMVENPSPATVRALLKFAKKSGQESVIYSEKGSHELHFVNGKNDHKHLKGFGTSVPLTPPEDNHMTMSDGTCFSHSFDPNNLYSKNNSMIGFHSRREQLQKSESTPNRTYIPFALKKSEHTGKEMKLIHYSPKMDLKEISPAFHGKRGIGAEVKYGVPKNKLAFFYREGSQPEDLVTTGCVSKYVVNLDKNHRLYDLGEDGEGVRDHLFQASQSKSINPGVYTNDDLHEELIKRGYNGFFNSKSALPDVVAMFHPMPVQKEHSLHPRDFKRASSINESDYDKSLGDAQDFSSNPKFLANLISSFKDV